MARLQGEGEPLGNRFAESLVQQELRARLCGEVPPRELDARAQAIFNKANCMQLYAKSARELLDEVPWLRRENTRGKEIYIRPEGHPGLILVDDIPAQTVDQLRRAGLAPAAVLETSKDNHQAWVRVDERELGPAVSTAVARELATRFEADQHSAKQRQFGRLAGFTNQKPARAIAEGPYAGLPPFVLLREASGQTAPAGPELVRVAQGRVRAQEQERAELLAREQALIREGKGYLGNVAGKEPAVDVLLMGRDHYQRISSSPRFHGDLSKLDWQVVCELTRDGYTAEHIAAALTALSPRLEERHNPADYVPRTVERAMEAVRLDAVARTLPAKEAAVKDSEPLTQEADPVGARESRV